MKKNLSNTKWKKITTISLILITIVYSVMIGVKIFKIDNIKKPIKIGEVSNNNEIEMNSISMGSHFSCAIKDDNSLWIWGNSNYSFIYGSQPTKILDDVISVKAGERWGSAITLDGTLWVWGDDVFNKSSKPRKALENVICTAQNAAIASDYTLWTWGDNYLGQLGDGTFEDSNAPKCVMHDVKYISSRGSRMAAIKTDGTLWMWGSNSRGNLGNGETDNSSVPVKVMDYVRYVDVGSDILVAITEKNE